MSGVTGARGSGRRKLLVCGGLALGCVILLLAGVMVEGSVKQVYWAVYSRLHPMKDFGEANGLPSSSKLFPTSNYNAADSGQQNAVDSGRQNAAEKAIQAGEKEEVRLVKTEADKIRHRDDEKLAASQAKLRQADSDTRREKDSVEDLAEQLSQKATEAFSKEIEAVAGSKEAERLTDGLQRDTSQGQTKLEKEAQQASAKSNKGAGLRKSVWQKLKFGD